MAGLKRVFDAIKEAKRLRRCVKCKKDQGLHKAKTLACPVGMKTRVGYCSYSQTDTFIQPEATQ